MKRNCVGCGRTYKDGWSEFCTKDCARQKANEYLRKYYELRKRL